MSRNKALDALRAARARDTAGQKPAKVDEQKPPAKVDGHPAQGEAVGGQRQSAAGERP